MTFTAHEKQITRGAGGRLLANIGVWSPDSQWIVYDTRPDAAGDVFTGSTIERVNVQTGEIQVLYRSTNGAHCGVPTHHPTRAELVFIHGPENPTPEWSYGPCHRQGVLLVEGAGPRPLDARDLTPPFTCGALRGGSHVHVWAPAGDWVSFTYNDALVERDLRDLGISLPGRPVRVARDHERNHDGDCFSVVVTRTTAQPTPGTDEIQRACEEGWVGTNGYLRANGTRQQRALAFQGQVVSANHQVVTEVFVVDLPEELAITVTPELAGDTTRRPQPPASVRQRRVTHTANRKHPGVQGPRHWLRSSPDGRQIAFLMKDDDGVVQLWSINPAGGEPRQISRNPWPITSAFTWSPDGRYLAHAGDGSVFLTEAATGKSHRLTPTRPGTEAPRAEACVFAPDGRKIALVRRVAEAGVESNQICVVTLDPGR
jgi:hypothetical protein